MKRVALDFDGSSGLTSDLMCQLFWFAKGERVTIKNTRTWSYWFDRGEEEFFWKCYDLMDSTTIRSAIEPYDKHFVPVMRNLMRQGLRFEIVTANQPKAEKSIRDWYNLHLRLRRPDLLYVRCLGRVSAREKVALDYDIFIDDSPAIADEIRHHPEKTLLLMNCPWNENVEPSPNMFRMRSWVEVDKKLRELGALDPDGRKHYGPTGKKV